MRHVSFCAQYDCWFIEGYELALGANNKRVLTADKYKNCIANENRVQKNCYSSMGLNCGRLMARLIPTAENYEGRPGQAEQAARKALAEAEKNRFSSLTRR